MYLRTFVLIETIVKEMWALKGWVTPSILIFFEKMCIHIISFYLHVQKVLAINHKTITNLKKKKKTNQELTQLHRSSLYINKPQLTNYHQNPNPTTICLVKIFFLQPTPFQSFMHLGHILTVSRDGHWIRWGGVLQLRSTWTKKS